MNSFWKELDNWIIFSSLLVSPALLVPPCPGPILAYLLCSLWLQPPSKGVSGMGCLHTVPGTIHMPPKKEDQRLNQYSMFEKWDLTLALVSWA